MNGLGSYRPGASPLHRAHAGAKLVALAAGMVALLRVSTLPGLAVARGVAVAAYAAGRVPPRAALAQVWPLRWFVLLVGAFQVVVAGWERAVLVVGTLVLAVAAAALVTLTTRVAELLDVLERVLSRLPRVNGARVALLAALGIRAVPVIAGLAVQVREAQQARGLRASPRLWAAPLVVRVLRHADSTGEALAARGIDD